MRISDWSSDVCSSDLNGRLDNIQAAILRLKLARYDDAIARRRAIASRYQAGLHDIAQLLLPPAPDSDNLRFDIFQNYEIQAENRDGLREHLAAKNVGTIIQWGGWMLHRFDAPGLPAHPPYPGERSKCNTIGEQHVENPPTNAHR